MKLGKAAPLAGVLLGAAIAMAGHAEAATSRPPSCASMIGRTVPGSNLKILKAEAVPAAPAGTMPTGRGPEKLGVALPAYCRVEGVIGGHTGADGKAYGLTVAIALPEGWNGRFLMQGGGGLNGTLRPPLGTEGAGGRPALARGFAVVSTDGGHQAAGFDGSFMADQQAALDFVYNAVPTVASAGKLIVAAYYGRPIMRSYFAGCSTGGREAMLASERYPDQFDGVVAGDPAMRTGYSNLALAWATQAFNAAAPRDAAGKPEAAKLFSAGDKALLISSLLASCDGLDGSVDGLIFDPGACRFDPAVLTCKAAKTDACLSKAQVTALKTAFAGPKTRGGVQVYPLYPWDTGIAATGQGIPGFLPSSAPSILGALVPSANKLDVDAAAAPAAADGVGSLVDTANWTNLSGFFGHGGKILYYHGLSDPWFSPVDTLDYYRRLTAANGGDEAVQGSSRIFLVPGMGHCQGGQATLDEFDLLGAVVDWVEHGKAPDSVVATGANMPGLSRPLCAWPTHAQYSGSGDPKLAASYQCRIDRD